MTRAGSMKHGSRPCQPGRPRYTQRPGPSATDRACPVGQTGRDVRRRPMAVLTSPRRTRPRFGPQAGLVATTRGVAFAALMAAGILLAGSSGPHQERVLLGFLAIGSGLGLIRLALPATLLGTRRLARLTRQL